MAGYLIKWEEERGKGALGIKSVFGTQSNGAFFFFFENGWLFVFNYFYKKAPSQMFERILNTILESVRLCKNS